ncbi:helix-turn-helix transcriptional regulator [Geothrix fuzhouensis]|uniref:helix-turn-helix transcriptional regulator n=1 Tax=Geothrix fuzhouensis TaxID=2966451 RepID=UPI0021498079|nr:helix-turn-helix domain-containing protein [Geothrix fuzhouensis]
MARPRTTPSTASKPTAPDPRLPAGYVAPRIPTEYVTVREAAAYTGLSKPTLDAMRQTGTGPKWVRVSPRRVVYEIAALREYMASRTVTPSPAV